HSPVHLFPTRRSSDLNGLLRKPFVALKAPVEPQAGGGGLNAQGCLRAALLGIAEQQQGDAERAAHACGDERDGGGGGEGADLVLDRKSTRLNSSHVKI